MLFLSVSISFRVHLYISVALSPLHPLPQSLSSQVHDCVAIFGSLSEALGLTLAIGGARFWVTRGIVPGGDL